MHLEAVYMNVFNQYFLNPKKNELNFIKIWNQIRFLIFFISFKQMCSTAMEARIYYIFSWKLLIRQ